MAASVAAVQEESILLARRVPLISTFHWTLASCAQTAAAGRKAAEVCPAGDQPSGRRRPFARDCDDYATVRNHLATLDQVGPGRVIYRTGSRDTVDI